MGADSESRPFPKVSPYTESCVRGPLTVCIKEGDELKTAFITRQGLFEATVMYFGFSNTLATFQSMINDILGDLIHIRLVMVYLDDIWDMFEGT